MAEHREIDCGLGIVHYFEWPCGHRFNQSQACPACWNRDNTNMWQARASAHKAQIEFRDRMLMECLEAFANLIEFDTISPEVKYKFYSLMLKLDEISKGLVNGKESEIE